MYDLEQKMRNVVEETVRILFPTRLAEAQIRRHRWWDTKYVGSKDGKAASWEGWSTNLAEVDSRYRAVFVDAVDNVLPEAERVALFGHDFAQAIRDMSRFVVMFVLDFPLEAVGAILDQAFVPRIMKRSAHACVVVSVDEFLSQPTLYWAAKAARLVMLQRFLATHRKPIDANEVPLQHLLYQSGYLHSYIVNGGLELLKLSEPRKSGEFGHDLQALVRNPVISALEAFPIGIELYTGALGYHVRTIPAYVNEYSLRGMIVISKDDPLPWLGNIASEFYLPIQEAKKLKTIGLSAAVAIHHLPLGTVAAELTRLRDLLNEMLTAP